MECCFNEHVESAECFVSRHRFSFWTKQNRFLLQWAAKQHGKQPGTVDFIEKRSRIRSRRRSVQPPLHMDEDFF